MANDRDDAIVIHLEIRVPSAAGRQVRTSLKTSNCPRTRPRFYTISRPVPGGTAFVKLVADDAGDEEAYICARGSYGPDGNGNSPQTVYARVYGPNDDIPDSPPANDLLTQSTSNIGGDGSWSFDGSDGNPLLPGVAYDEFPSTMPNQFVTWVFYQNTNAAVLTDVQTFYGQHTVKNMTDCGRGPKGG
jgi:hypothetical protein